MSLRNRKVFDQNNVILPGVGELDLALLDIPCRILINLCLTEFQYWLSESEGILEEKEEPESQILINTQRAKRHIGTTYTAEGVWLVKK